VIARMLGDGVVEQNLGEIELSEPETVDGIRFTAVVVGNPHAVVDGDPATITEVGPFLETHERFPRRTNVQVARRLGPGVIEARVWERGAGETAASGSSAVAVAAAFGLQTETIRFPGGPLEVRFDGRRAFLTGPARRVD
jgi:diaminopimelate epimerase